MFSTTRFAVDDLINIPDRELAIREILRGTFDDEIKRVKAARDELAKQQTVAKTVQEAEKVKAAAEETRASAEKFKAEVEKQAQTTVDQAQVVFASAKAAQKNANEAAAKVAADRTTLDAQKKAQDDREAMLAAREKGINTANANLQRAVAEHADKVKAFNARLEALKVS